MKSNNTFHIPSIFYEDNEGATMAKVMLMQEYNLRSFIW